MLVPIFLSRPNPLCDMDFCLFLLANHVPVEIPAFLDLLTSEVEMNPSLQLYYKLAAGGSRYLYRRAYLEQRLQYVDNQLGRKPLSVWDAGCGYGTTSIFLAMKGHLVYGSTLEHYYEAISDRLPFWSRYVNLDTLRIEYRDLFDEQPQPGSFDAIIAQDALHHLEPASRAVRIFYTALKESGSLIVTEENGNCLFIGLKNFLKRGFNKTIKYYDPQLGKQITLADEHARSLGEWRKLLLKEGFKVDDKNVEYIRMFPPLCFTAVNYPDCILRERNMCRRMGLLREVCCFGVNFSAVKVVS